jgi:DNA helicase-2/ATP-dependent DNA helicase PcrA
LSYSERSRSLGGLRTNTKHALVCNQQEPIRRVVLPSLPLSLNPEQRLAAGYRVHAPGESFGPLLIIAGAGSGKTNTLAHRVAHLIVGGADPRRILILTFSRRAASEMRRRVERISANVIGEAAGTMSDALTWAGTFHRIGARLLRDCAGQIALDSAFTIHDREDSADLMNLVRHELDFSKTKSRFPGKGMCLAVYSRCVNAEIDRGRCSSIFSVVLGTDPAAQ